MAQNAGKNYIHLQCVRDCVNAKNRSIKLVNTKKNNYIKKIDVWQKLCIVFNG